MANSVQYGELKIGRRLGGGTGAYLATWQERPYVFKAGGGRNSLQARSEILALRLFSAAGVRVPEEIHEVYKGDAFAGLLISYIEGATPSQLYDDGITPPGSEELNVIYEAIERNYVIHALFANWDARNADNYMIAGKDGVWDFAHPYVIDLGGALMFRAMGAFAAFKFPERGIRNDEGNLASLAAAASPGRYFDRFKDPMLRHRAICERWATVDQHALLQTLDANAHLVVDTYDELRRRLQQRMLDIDAYCERPPEAPAAVGGRHRKTRRWQRRQRKSRRNKSRISNK